MSDNLKITLIAIVVIILGNGIANADNYFDYRNGTHHIEKEFHNSKNGTLNFHEYHDDYSTTNNYTTNNDYTTTSNNTSNYITNDNTTNQTITNNYYEDNSSLLEQQYELNAINNLDFFDIGFSTAVTLYDDLNKSKVKPVVGVQYGTESYRIKFIASENQQMGSLSIKW